MKRHEIASLEALEDFMEVQFEIYADIIEQMYGLPDVKSLVESPYQIAKIERTDIFKEPGSINIQRIFFERKQYMIGDRVLYFWSKI